MRQVTSRRGKPGRARPGIACLFAAALLLSASTPARPSSELAVAGIQRPVEGPVNPKVVFLGLEAAAWRHLRPLIRAGKLPNLARLYRAGAKAPLATLSPAPCVRVWNTMVTGKEPAEHGIVSLGYRDPVLGRVLPTTTWNRQAKTIWEMLSENGKKVGVAGLWTTWPPDPVNGFIISSYHGRKIGPQHFSRIFDSRGFLGQPTTQGTIYADAALGMTYPNDLYPSIEPFILAAENNIGTRIQTIVTLPSRYQNDLENIEAIKWVLASDEAFNRAGLKSYVASRPDFFLLYLRGLDTVSHRVYRYDWKAKYGDAMTNYYLYLDRFVGRMRASADPDSIFIIASDHGDDGGGEHGTSSPPGILIISGPNVVRGWIGPATVRDLVPTVLYLMGLPVADDMPGHILSGALEQSFLDGHPVGRIATYGPPSHGDPSSLNQSPFDRAIGERLIKLGTVGGN